MTDRTKLSDEALDKFEAFLRRLATAKDGPHGGLGSELTELVEFSEEAQALVDEYLPAPVDPMVLEAREIAKP